MGEHKVEKGETLSGIAKQYGMNFGELLKLNGIDPSKADYIQIGQVIKTNKKPKQSSSNQSIPLQGFSSQIVDGASDWATQKVEEVSRLSRGAEQTVQVRKNSDEKANAGVKAPMKPKLVSKEKAQAINLQEQLYALGYDLGPYGIDGDFGNDSKKALAQAQADGYVLENGKLIKKVNTSQSNPKNSNTQQQVPTFDEYLYITGANMPIRNVYDMAETAASSFLGLNTKPGEGATRQALAQMINPIKVKVKDENGRIQNVDAIHYDSSTRYMGKNARSVGTMLRDIDWNNVKTIPTMASNFTIGQNNKTDEESARNKGGWTQTSDGGYYLNDPTDFHMLTVKNPTNDPDKPFINVGSQDPRYEDLKQSTSFWGDVKSGLWRNPAALIENMGTRQGWSGGSRQLTITPEDIEAYRKEYEATIADPEKLQHYYQQKEKISS